MRACTIIDLKDRSRTALPWRTLMFWLLLWSGNAAVHSAGATTLVWKLAAGQRFALDVERTVHQKSPTTDWSETIRYQVLWEVTGRDEQERADVVQTLTEVKHTLQFLDMPPVVFDSTSEAEPRGDAAELARYWKPLLQAARTMVLLPNGRLVPPAPAEAPAPTATPTPTPAPAPPAASAVANLSARPLADIYWQLPEQDLTLGDSWSETHLVPWRDVAEGINVITSYTYQGQEVHEQRRLDKIVVQTRWEVKPQPLEAGELKLERQTGTGAILFDASAGHLARSDYSQELVFRIARPKTEAVQAEISTTLKVRCQPVVVLDTAGTVSSAERTGSGGP